MKKFVEEFKAFISKGDVVSMAVGLMVGSAFTAIITALNANIITPILGIIMGGIDFSGIIIKIGAAAGRTKQSEEFMVVDIKIDSV